MGVVLGASEAGDQLLVPGKAGLCGESQTGLGLVSSKLHKRQGFRKQVQAKHKTPQSLHLAVYERQ